MYFYPLAYVVDHLATQWNTCFLSCLKLKKVGRSNSINWSPYGFLFLESFGIYRGSKSSMAITFVFVDFLRNQNFCLAWPNSLKKFCFLKRRLHLKVNSLRSEVTCCLFPLFDRDLANWWLSVPKLAGAEARSTSWMLRLSLLVSFMAGTAKKHI